MFIVGLFYAFGNFITTSRKFDFGQRRLWAYESWIIFSFYGLFLFLTLLEKEFKIGKIKRPHLHLAEFKKLLLVNLILLVFPWGLFLLFAPASMLELLKLNSVYWRILGGMSLVGALIYYFPYRFYAKRLSYYIIAFGALDNFLAGAIVTALFVSKRVGLVAWSATPLLFYFAYFFKEQAEKYKHLAKK
ncbi:hypothetical protein A2630_02015 [Candidatus Woesebacteria bacterium RIFCSPHIGHO2_01_FULL_44_10]|uniref:Uncharacterized protein n=1 Tax=Candidatus Woesebacteria bacterium RIFCSPLOWO2_01_FULL_44_14 TaxID=1802525 RepID=A0A1F8BY03_9BACT|nr:MAG: hypothetical protein A2630_02015 [Candidatus Woesebacteria bacterium RIFCSPHIGHO2_01_FULL_44_10]OGM55788.1 MAG: hypothetical protein A3F62_04150 [Candidatus Woesebacteria bacterium RIFCSPHIGHO2_12_FULL_44_11]OGM68983.1 MAG: hypothetical protein A2975_02270 [Candidatus Woesebacteria bacterium RIFCSPLOWO2_01_FULL_44_14]